MTPRDDHNAAALESLLPLLECHLDLHGRIVPRAQWESTYDPPPAGWVPPKPEPDCDGGCPRCADFQTRRCHLLEERWASEWARLRKRYPVLGSLERLLADLMAERPHWASALYWVHVQPWDAWAKDKRAAWAREGIGWLCERIDWWLPVYVPEGMPVCARSEGAKDRDIIRLRIEGKSYHAIAKALGCSKSTVSAVLHGKEVRQGRTKSAESP